MSNRGVKYRKAASGVMLGQPFVLGETDAETAKEVTADATAQRTIIKDNSQVVVGAPAEVPAPSKTNYLDHKSEYSSTVSGLSTISADNPVQPGKNTIAMDTLKSAGKYAALGASIGSVFPGLGTVIGGGVGALVGAGLGFFKGKKKQKENEKAFQEQMELRREEESLYAKAKTGALRNYSAGRTQHFMDQANSLYGNTGKVVGVARRGGIVYSPIHLITYTNNVTIKPVSMPITAAMVRKASKGAKVALTNNVTMLCSRANNSCQLTHKSESPFHRPIFRRGGSIVNKMKTNIIPRGVSHEEENNTGVKGDKGLPIVQNGEKMFELETSEWVLNADQSKTIESKVYQYLEDPSDEILISIGKIIQHELHVNTYSYDEAYAHLNH